MPTDLLSQRPFYFLLTLKQESVRCIGQFHNHFFLPLALLFVGAGAGVEPLDITLEAREEGAADVALLPAPDLRLSSALFYEELACRIRKY
jgi:hypothetical protein